MEEDWYVLWLYDVVVCDPVLGDAGKMVRNLLMLVCHCVEKQFVQYVVI